MAGQGSGVAATVGCEGLTGRASGLAVKAQGMCRKPIMKLIKVEASQP